MTDVAVDLTSDPSEPQEQLEAVEQELQEVDAQIEVLLARQQHLQKEREQLQYLCSTNERAPKADWAGKFDWDHYLNKALAEQYGLTARFRPMQREVINATLQGRDVLCLMPSGGGKSLCYQMPALIREGLTLVISPLLSLIQDQVDRLQGQGVAAVAVTSLTPKEEVNQLYKQIETDKHLKLLYATPERIVSAKRFMGKLEKLHKSGRLARIAIDEAHCCSQWGNDFRPDYRKLAVLKQQFPTVPLIALTATATEDVCQDLKDILQIEGCERFKSSVNRPNLFYQVRPKPASNSDLSAAIASCIAEEDGASGIVYCLTRKETEQVAVDLQAAGISCGTYHADMDPASRMDIHKSWTAGQLQVIVATVAFGMGIDKPDVRFVIHHSMSKSIENYYQESGRAGRDGQLARCILFYRFADALRQASIVSLEPGWQPRLMKMACYAAAVSTCRHSFISRHFAEAPAACSSHCDCCCRPAGSVITKDVSTAAQDLTATLDSFPSSDRRATLNQLVDRWRSGKGVGISGKSMSKDECEQVVGSLFYDGLLSLEMGYTAYATNSYLKLSPKGSRLLQGNRLQVRQDIVASEHHSPRKSVKRRKKEAGDC
ncbi:hypothetical protein WJX74_008097 [Apatococcus lobatus]|uniref:ATP-dependent DNA helicase n=1 Tax=Apatococcus lobatus TaxID=904363 RepID=A0AAW1QHK0_9CHLO